MVVTTMLFIVKGRERRMKRKKGKEEKEKKGWAV
jgi:hypothetical protein